MNLGTELLLWLWQKKHAWLPSTFKEFSLQSRGFFFSYPGAFRCSVHWMFFKILGMRRHNSTVFYCFCLFMTSLTKSRQGPLHLLNLLTWCNSLVYTCCSDVEESTKHKRETRPITWYHHQSSCVLVYILVLALPETDRTDPRNPCRGREKVAVGRTAGFQSLHSLSFHLVDWGKHFRLGETQELLKTEALAF